MGYRSIIIAAPVLLSTLVASSAYAGGSGGNSSDDTLCQAIGAANGGPVDWPDDEEYWFVTKSYFDGFENQPWYCYGSQINYITDYGPFTDSWVDKGGTDNDVCSLHQEYDRYWNIPDTPLGRMLNGFSHIVYANAEGSSLDRTRSRLDFDYYSTMTKWMSAAVYQYSFPIVGSCVRDCDSNGFCTFAKTKNRVIHRKDVIEYYQTFYYDIDSLQRAATIVHEARHAYPVSHDGESCSNGGSCDETWTSAGANTFEMLWLAAYKWAPQNDSDAYPFVRTPASIDRAAVLFEATRTTKFDTVPQWTLDHMIYINVAPEYYLRYAICSEETFSGDPACGAGI